MTTHIASDIKKTRLTENEQDMAREASRRLSGRTTSSIRFSIGEVDGSEEVLEIPPSAIPLFSRILTEIGAGRSVAVLAEKDELSTNEAADLLNVSRPFLIGLLEKGAMPFRRVGTHRRVQLNDLLEYQRKDMADRMKAMEALAEQAQALDMGY